MNDQGTIAQLHDVQIELKEEKLEGGLEKAMQSYQHFLVETSDSALAPEAIRRLADLKIEKEYGTLTDTAATAGGAPSKAKSPPQKAMGVPEKAALVKPPVMTAEKITAQPLPMGRPAAGESESDFEKRTTRSQPAAASGDRSVDLPQGAEGADDLERAGALEAVVLYQQLLDKYPLYDRNDQVLYQMSRAYEELGRIPEAMSVMDRLVREFPHSRYIDEVQFRRAEYFFMHRKYMDAEESYATIVEMGVGSSYYELAIYKLGWTYYKQELYEDALHRFIALLDYKTGIGFDFEQTEDETERKRTDDTFRVISLSFSNLGGAESVVAYFQDNGQRIYEDRVYRHLAEFYFDKRRYADASATYNAFVTRNPFHKKAPNFQMRVIEIHTAGGFPTLVLDAKKDFARTYGLKAPYWAHFDPEKRPDVLGHLKTNLKDLATHYHACYQDKRQAKDKPTHFREALLWYREFLSSFPADDASSTINYHLADLLLENRSFGEAALEYEKTAYGYATNEKSSAAGYAAVIAHREHLAATAPESQTAVKREVVRSSLRFADTFPEHEKAPVVLGAAADDLYLMEEYEQALAAATKLLDTFPETETEVTRTAHLVVGHSCYELARYAEAEAAYVNVLALMPESDKNRPEIIDNLAAAIYKQGEQANAAEDYRAAAEHFLRVGRIAPTSKLRANAEYDGATALIQLKDWPSAVTVLLGFRKTFPDHPLQPEATKKIAYVYREDGKLSLAAAEYERIETESEVEEIRREALLTAAQLYGEDKKPDRALVVYRRYVGYFPEPVDVHIETRNTMAEILKAQNDQDAYVKELKQIVAIEGAAGQAQTPRTRYLAAKASLVLGELTYDRFIAVKLVKPFEENLLKKQALLKAATNSFNTLMTYEVGETTAAATFYLAEIYAHFCKALLASERPDGLSDLELEQYELAIEEQAYPFEDKAIAVHEKNLEMISLGVYNPWIEKSLQKLAVFIPARYDKPEEASSVITSPDIYAFVLKEPPAAVAEGDGVTTAPTQESAAAVAEDQTTGQPEQDQVSVSVEAQQPVTIPGTTARPDSTVGGTTVSTDEQASQPSAKQEVPEAATVEQSATVQEQTTSADREDVESTADMGNLEAMTAQAAKEKMAEESNHDTHKDQ